MNKKVVIGLIKARAEFTKRMRSYRIRVVPQNCRTEDTCALTTVGE